MDRVSSIILYVNNATKTLRKQIGLATKAQRHKVMRKYTKIRLFNADLFFSWCLSALVAK